MRKSFFHHGDSSRAPLTTLGDWMLACVFGLSLVVGPGANADDDSPSGYLALTDVRIMTAAKEGTIDRGTVLIRDGQIEAVGQDVSIPAGSAVLSAPGKTIMPGVIDPYYVIRVSGAPVSTQRTIVFQGRVFVIGGSPAANDNNFVRLEDAFVPENWNWRAAIRSGITTVNLTSRGFGLSCTASPRIDSADVRLDTDSPQTYIAVSNEPGSLKVLRGGLKPPRKSSSSSSRSSTSSSRSSSSSKTDSKDDDAPEEADSKTDPNDPWEAIRAGERPLLVNANNAAAVLYVAEELKKDENKKVELGLVVSGQDALLCMESLEDFPADRLTLILQPTLTTETNTQRLVNVAAMAAEREIPFVFSPASRQSDFRNSQDVPFFSVSQLVHYGLDPELALQALTSGPAELIGLGEKTGSVEPEKRADLILLDGDPMTEMARIERVWSGGREVYSFESGQTPALAGSGS
ncbi:MAG: amidohydrolase family protein [Planctomycetota bacterium]